MDRERLQGALRALGKLTGRDREAILLAADPEMAVEEAARRAGHQRLRVQNAGPQGPPEAFVLDGVGPWIPRTGTRGCPCGLLIHVDGLAPGGAGSRRRIRCGAWCATRWSHGSRAGNGAGLDWRLPAATAALALLAWGFLSLDRHAEAAGQPAGARRPKPGGTHHQCLRRRRARPPRCRVSGRVAATRGHAPGVVEIFNRGRLHGRRVTGRQGAVLDHRR